MSIDFPSAVLRLSEHSFLSLRKGDQIEDKAGTRWDVMKNTDTSSGDPNVLLNHPRYGDLTLIWKTVDGLTWVYDEDENLRLDFNERNSRVRVC